MLADGFQFFMGGTTGLHHDATTISVVTTSTQAQGPPRASADLNQTAIEPDHQSTQSAPVPAQYTPPLKLPRSARCSCLKSLPSGVRNKAETKGLLKRRSMLEVSEEVDAERVLQDIAHALPYDKPGKVFQTMIAWGRFAGIRDYNATTKTVFVPHDGKARPSKL